MSLIKSHQEIAQLKKDGRKLANILKEVSDKVRPGIKTIDLDRMAEEMIVAIGGRPAFKGYGTPDNPFPGTLCVSINEEVVHGIPSDRQLKEGDIISIDVGMEKEGLFTDMATTVPVGKINKDTERLLQVTKKSLYLAIKQCKIGNKLGDIGFAVQSYAEKNGFAVIRDLVGHGVGHAVHEEPNVPNFGSKNQGFELQEGMVIALEPMLTNGSFEIDYKADNWTIKTADNSLSAHYEHTVAITTKGPLIITEL